MTPLPLSTNLFTLLAKLGLRRINVGASRTAAGLFVSDECTREISQITPTEDLQNAYAKLRMLEQDGLEICSRLGFCSFPLKGTSGLFEIRKNGVRIYGCRIISVNSALELLSLLGAEQKSGRSEVNKALVMRYQAKEIIIHKEFNRINETRENDIERARVKRFAKKQRNK